MRPSNSTRQQLSATNKKPSADEQTSLSVRTSEQTNIRGSELLGASPELECPKQEARRGSSCASRGLRSDINQARRDAAKRPNAARGLRQGPPNAKSRQNSTTVEFLSGEIVRSRRAVEHGARLRTRRRLASAARFFSSSRRFEDVQMFENVQMFWPYMSPPTAIASFVQLLSPSRLTVI